jgi:hypothetical protein
MQPPVREADFLPSPQHGGVAVAGVQQHGAQLDSKTDRLARALDLHPQSLDASGGQINSNTASQTMHCVNTG